MIPAQVGLIKRLYTNYNTLLINYTSPMMNLPDYSQMENSFLNMDDE
jgi:hypothetical protein